MAKMGLRQSANRDIRPTANRAAVRSTPGGQLLEACEVSRLFGKFFFSFKSHTHLPVGRISAWYVPPE